MIEASSRLRASNDALSKRLFLISQAPVVDNYQYGNDPDKDVIAKKGKDYTRMGQFVRGRPAECHWNVARAYLEGSVDAIVIGYAHNFQGWHQHTWGLNGGVLVETTEDNKTNDHWFGYKLTNKEAAAFAEHCATFVPGMEMIRTKRGGSLQDLVNRYQKG